MITRKERGENNFTLLKNNLARDNDLFKIFDFEKIN